MLLHPVFSIIIPVFNKWQLTKNCLISLKKYTHQVPFEVIVVDNGSTDETAAALPFLGNELFGSSFTCLRYECNTNFAPACNNGAQTAQAPLLFFLNNDTLVTENWHGPLLGALATNNSLGAVGPLLLYPDNRVQHLGITHGLYGLLHLYRLFPADHPLVRKQRYLQGLTAAALMVSKDLFWQCGGFFEGYKNGFEDVELSIRLRQAGKKLTCVPESQIYHLESQTPERKAYEHENSRLFTERCAKDVYPDIHHHALRDGLSVTLDEAYDLSIALTEKHSNALLTTADNSSTHTLVHLVNENPYWLQGHQILAQLYADHEKYLEAATHWGNAAQIHASQFNLNQLLHCADKCHEPEIVTTTKLHLRNIMIVQTSRQAALKVINRHLKLALEKSDNYLMNLYSAALKKRSSDPVEEEIPTEAIE